MMLALVLISLSPCNFGDNVYDLMDGKVAGIQIDSKRILKDSSDLTPIERDQILDAFFNNWLGEEKISNLDQAISYVDDQLVNLLKLREISTGKLFTLVEFGFGNSNSFGAIYPIDSIKPLIKDEDGQLVPTKPQHCIAGGP
ncbi:MAG: hypothetical protein WCK42_09020 [Myxococcaceae bacterium]